MASTTTNEAVPSSGTPRPAKATKAVGPVARTAKRVHFVIQGKGGIGKSYVASLIAQYLREEGRAPICFDTDPVNRSLSGFKALAAEPVDLLDEDAINVVAVDTMIERVLKTDTAEIVVDAGAASFLPLSRYLIENDIAGLIEGAEKQMVVHAIIVGGGNAIDTAKGFEAIVRHFPPSVQVVVWLNEFWGRVAVDGIGFEDTPLFHDNSSRIAGVITLRQQNPQTFGTNIGQMLDRKLTFAEAIDDTEAFMTVPRQRLILYRRSIWDQLVGVI